MDETRECQIQCIPGLTEENVEIGLLPLRRRVKIELKRRLNARTKRKLKKTINRLISAFSLVSDEGEATSTQVVKVRANQFKPGELVQVRSREEIEATIDRWGELNGCLFFDEMWQYCGTTQRVLKPVERFVDERDYRVKKTKGLVLLDGLMCQGTPDYGRCDRACFYFWRVEWLEKIEMN